MGRREEARWEREVCVSMYILTVRGTGEDVSKKNEVDSGSKAA
jgi:hypothetical protein